MEVNKCRYVHILLILNNKLKLNRSGKILKKNYNLILLKLIILEKNKFKDEIFFIQKKIYLY
jgi:hypothetical protein